MELLEALHNTSHVASTSELKSIAYYQMLYVRQGKSGLFRDSAATKCFREMPMLHKRR